MKNRNLSATVIDSDNGLECYKDIKAGDKFVFASESPDPDRTFFKGDIVSVKHKTGRRSWRFEGENGEEHEFWGVPVKAWKRV